VRTQVAAGASDDKLFHAARFAASRYFKIKFGSHNENAGTYVTSISGRDQRAVERPDGLHDRPTEIPPMAHPTNCVVPTGGVSTPARS